MTLRTLIVTTRRMAWTAAMIGGVVLGSTVPVGAQQDGRLFIDINGGLQVTSTDFTDNIVITEFVEDGDLDATYAIDSGVILDIGGGVRLPGNLGVGVGFSRFDRSNDARVDARIPHPFFFDRDRSITGTATNLTRTETAVHLQLRWFAPLRSRVSVSLFGGPTFFQVTQDLVTAVSFAQTYPFDVASFTSASTAEQSESAVGYNVGADVGYFFSQHVGVGGLIRYSAGSVDLPSQDDVSIDLGGLHAGGGLKLRF